MQGGSSPPPGAPGHPRRSNAARAVRLLAVAASVLLLFVLSAFAMRPRLGPGIVKVHVTDAMKLRRAVQIWRGSHASDACPTVEQLREDRLVDPQSKVTDAWGTPFQITCEPDETLITSLGPDRKPSADDIVTPGSEPDARVLR